MVMEEATFRVKIGFSNNPVRRCRELYSSGVPYPFHILHVWEVLNMREVETLIHNELILYRLNLKREFFDISEQYIDDIDFSLPDTINGLNGCNWLSNEIDGLLQKHRVEFRRWYLNHLESYYMDMRASKKK